MRIKRRTSAQSLKGWVKVTTTRLVVVVEEIVEEVVEGDMLKITTGVAT